MRQFGKVFKFEYTNYTKSKGYIGITVFMLLVAIIITSLPNIASIIDGISGGGETAAESPIEQNGGEGEASAETQMALIADSENIYTDDILNSYLQGYQWERVLDLSEAEELIASEEYDLAISIEGLNYTVYERAENMFTGSADRMVSEMVKFVSQMRFLDDRGLNADESLEVLNMQPIGNVITVGRDVQQTFWLSYVVLFLMYFIIMLYGQFVMTSVVTEKSTKAMELLITSAKPFQLIMGKVMGVGAAGLTQFGVIMLTVFGMFRLNIAGWTEFAPAVALLLETSVSPLLLLYAFIFLILGFFSFSFILGGFGSTVSRLEEANSIMVMPMFLFMIAFFVAMFGSMTPEAGFVTVCSFVPFLSPMVMFMRICVTGVPIIQILIAIVINIATVFGAAFVCSRIYRVGVMLYGKKPNIKDMIKYVTRT